MRESQNRPGGRAAEKSLPDKEFLDFDAKEISNEDANEIIEIEGAKDEAENWGFTLRKFGGKALDAPYSKGASYQLFYEGQMTEIIYSTTDHVWALFAHVRLDDGSYQSGIGNWIQLTFSSLDELVKAAKDGDFIQQEDHTAVDLKKLIQKS